MAEPTFPDLNPPVIAGLDTEGKTLFGITDAARVVTKPGQDVSFVESRLRRWNRRNLVWTSATKPFGAKRKSHLFAAHDLGAAVALDALSDMGVERHDVFQSLSLACYCWPKGKGKKYPPIGMALLATMKGTMVDFQIDALRSPDGRIKYIAEIRFDGKSEAAAARVSQLCSEGWEIRGSWMLVLNGVLRDLLNAIARLKVMH